VSLVQNLKRNFGNFQIDIPRWEILDQGVTALWGKSGSGKSTILRCLLGLDSCPGLTWTIDGKNLANLSIGDRRIGVVFQGYELFPHMTAAQNILFAARARRRSLDESTKDLMGLADQLSITKVLHQIPSHLSGGEQQRVALARALIGQPRIIFLDEPFSALDEDLRQEARELVRRILSLNKIPAVLISHDQRDIDFLGNKITLLAEGKIVKESSL